MALRRKPQVGWREPGPGALHTCAWSMEHYTRMLRVYMLVYTRWVHTLHTHHTGANTTFGDHRMAAMKARRLEPKWLWSDGLNQNCYGATA